MRSSGTCHPTSPDLNPIELWFAKLKALLRTARRRTVEERWKTVAACLSLFSATAAMRGRYTIVTTALADLRHENGE